MTVWATSAVRTSSPIWAAVSPTRDGLVRIDGDLDLGRGLDQVALEVGEVGRGPTSASTSGRRRLLDRRGPSALTMMFRPFEVKPAASETLVS